MLQRTFLHISGVGPKRELEIWRRGIGDWREFLARGRERLPARIYNLGRPVVERSLAALGDRQGVRWLAEVMPRAEHWRFFPTLERVVYLDIESGGDPAEWGGITVVGLYDGSRVEQYVADHNIWLVDTAMNPYDVVVTFGGSTFDLPMLKRHFPNLILPPVHIDLRWPLKRLGLAGGLKRIEKTLGIARPAAVRGLTGWDAVRLWRHHQQGRPGALERLLAYNACDVVNLKPLLAHAVARLKQQLRFLIDLA